MTTPFAGSITPRSPLLKPRTSQINLLLIGNGSYSEHDDSSTAGTIKKLDKRLGRVTGTADPLSKINLLAGGRHELSRTEL
ncbi:hypothetical protein Tco_0658743 [Tanacetum coccineum]